MTALELSRNRMVLFLLFLVPSLFYTIVALTTSTKKIAFKLAAINETTFVQVSQRDESLVFIGLASIGLLTSFVAMSLLRKHAEVHRRLIFCGFRASEVLISRLLILLLIIVGVSVFVGAMILLFFSPKRFGLLLLGFALGGWVYGCYGLLIGAIFRRELEAVLFISLLANIDAGWLQNPLYYADANNTQVIRSLPAYFPSQTSMIAAFTQHGLAWPIFASVLYGIALLVLALVLFHYRIRLFTHE